MSRLRRFRRLVARGALVAGLSCSSREVAEPGGGAAEESFTGSSPEVVLLFDDCSLGSFTCDGAVALACDASSQPAERDCAAEGLRCRQPQGCVPCSPGEATCDGGRARHCNAEGTAFVHFECDVEQGMTCESDGCKGICSPAELGASYQGCDYYPTVTPNPVYDGFQFAVAVANSGAQPARVIVTRGDEAYAEQSVPAGGLRTIPLPWVTELKGGDQDACQVPPPLSGSRRVEDGAYRLRSDQPVSVYQFNPLQYELAPAPESCPLRERCPGSPSRDEGCLSFSNDASLLFPVNALTGSYAALSWPSTQAGQSFLSVVGTEEDTIVTLDGAGAVVAGAGVDASGFGQVTLGRGDVLQVLAPRAASQEFGSDLSGTIVSASAPVQVVSGSSCGFVPEPTTEACDHLEHASLPSETLGREYLVTFPAAPASLSPQVVRLLAVLPDTRVEFDPPVAGLGARTVLSPSQGPLSIPATQQDFRIVADQPIAVAHYLQGRSSVASGAGDPSMAVVVPRAQYRDDYVFTVSQTYDFNYVNVVAPVGASVRLDGELIPDASFDGIGNTGFRVARYQLPAEREVFRMQGSEPFGIFVYGYGAFTSYLYPGGLDLRKIAQPIIR